MRKIAIIGAGQAGLLTAHGLLKAGYTVSLYSDKTPEQFLNESRPTGTAVRPGRLRYCKGNNSQTQSINKKITGP